jgi:hypothetical protein
MRSLYRRFARPVLSRFPGLKSGLLALARREPPHEDPASAAREVLAPDEVLRQLEDSLECLRRDRVDIYLVHEPDRFELTDELQACFRDLQSKGLIGAFGLGYGREARHADPRFGSVLQARYEGALREPSPGTTRIFHGVLRQASAAQGATARIGEVLRAWPQAAVIFSASAPFQIRDVAVSAHQAAAGS